MVNFDKVNEGASTSKSTRPPPVATPLPGLDPPVQSHTVGPSDRSPLSIYEEDSSDLHSGLSQSLFFSETEGQNDQSEANGEELVDEQSQANDLQTEGQKDSDENVLPINDPRDDRVNPGQPPQKNQKQTTVEKIAPIFQKGRKTARALQTPIRVNTQRQKRCKSNKRNQHTGRSGQLSRNAGENDPSDPDNSSNSDDEIEDNSEFDQDPLPDRLRESDDEQSDANFPLQQARNEVNQGQHDRNDLANLLQIMCAKMFAPKPAEMPPFYNEFIVDRFPKFKYPQNIF